MWHGMRAGIELWGLGEEGKDGCIPDIKRF